MENSNNLDLEARKIELENRDQKEDAQRHMAWWALGGMLTFPLLTFVASIYSDNAGKVLSDMSATYFIAVAGILAAFYGKEAYMSKK